MGRTVIWRGLIGTALLASAAQALTPGEKCEADKLKTAGRYTLCRLNAEAKAISRALPPDYAKCDAKYALKWGAAEDRAAGSCPVTGDQAAIQLQASSATDELAAAIGGNPPGGCPGDLLACQSDLGACGDTVSVCTTELATCAGDLTGCHADLASCETDLAAATLCGNGVVDPGEDCDQGALAGASCVTEGFAGGVLSCTGGCAFDTSRCWTGRFTDNADGTITDHLTGLMWEKKTELNGVMNFANLHDADNRYRWSGTCTIATGKRCQPTVAAAALCGASVEGHTDGCALCLGGDGTCNQAATIWTAIAAMNSAGFAGHDDWRAPRLRELQGIVEYGTATVPAVDPAFHGASCGAACSDLSNAACSCTQAYFYWTGSTYTPDTSNAWFTYFADGTVFALSKPDDALPVRAVRAAP